MVYPKPCDFYNGSEKMNEELKAISEIVNSDIAKEAYNDGAKPMIKSIGGIFGTLFGFVDNVIFELGMQPNKHRDDMSIIALKLLKNSSK